MEEKCSDVTLYGVHFTSKFLTEQLPLGIYSSWLCYDIQRTKLEGTAYVFTFFLQNVQQAAFSHECLLLCWWTYQTNFEESDSLGYELALPYDASSNDEAGIRCLARQRQAKWREWRSRENKVAQKGTEIHLKWNYYLKKEKKKRQTLNEIRHVS